MWKVQVFQELLGDAQCARRLNIKVYMINITSRIQCQRTHCLSLSVCIDRLVILLHRTDCLSHSIDILRDDGPLSQLYQRGSCLISIRLRRGLLVDLVFLSLGILDGTLGSIVKRAVYSLEFMPVLVQDLLADYGWGMRVPGLACLE